MSKYPTTRRSHIYRRSHPSLRRISVDPWSRLPKDTILHSYDTIIEPPLPERSIISMAPEFAIFLSRSSLDVTRKQLLPKLLRAFRLFAHAKFFSTRLSVRGRSRTIDFTTLIETGIKVPWDRSGVVRVIKRRC